MGTKDSDSLHEKGYACSKRRKGNVANTVVSSKRRALVEDKKLFMAPHKRPFSKKGPTKRFVKEDIPHDKLVKIELDAAHALAEFSRIAYLPVQEGKGRERIDASLQWSAKRKRSLKPSKEVSLTGKEHDARLLDDKTPRNSLIHPNSSAEPNRYTSDEDKGNYLTVERDELENNIMPESSKESLRSDSRAESPSSPLPSLQLKCGTILIGGPANSSAFQRVVRPVRKPCSLPIKPKVEDIYIDDPQMSELPATVPAQKLTVKKRPRFFKPAVLAASVKLEQLVVANSFTSSDQQKQEEARDAKDITYQNLTVGDSGVESLVGPAPEVVEPSGQGFRVKGKHKPALTEIEKEARKLRRIYANRESARQTIRKKQILCEELARKSTSLALENQDMKQKKDEMMKHLQFLKDQNRLLKQQLVMQQDMGHDYLLQSSRFPLKPIRSTSLQGPVLPCAGIPVQSLVGTLAAAEATGVNQACMGKSGVMISGSEHYIGTSANDSSGSGLGLEGSRHNQPPACCIDASDKVSTSGFTELQTVGKSNDSSSLSPVSLASKERSSVSGETSAVQSTGAPCECHELDCDRAILDVKEAQQGSENVNAADLIGFSSCQSNIQARSVSSQAVAGVPTSSFRSQAGTSELDEACGSLMAPGNLGHGFVIPGTSSYGIPLNGNRTVVTLEGSLQMSLFPGRRISATAIAAAEARRRRKELTRRKFWQSRTLRRHR